MKRYLDLDAVKRVDLPQGSEIVAQGLDLGQGVEIGQTAFLKKHGLKSEAEYKKRMKQAGKVMFHAHIGLNSWPSTAEALKYLSDQMEFRGLSLDRFGLCLDRAMGLPLKDRHHIPRETGPRLESAEDWHQVGWAAPIQPHAGDFMIGFPNSVENCCLALQAGVTTIGNLSQYFAQEIPGWSDDVWTTVETVKALAIMAAHRDDGALVHSYLDDGFGALFTDYATTAGWVMLEKYIVEELIGAKLAPSFGGMTARPEMRLAWILLLDEIFGPDLLGSMFYGDTISYTADSHMNLGVVANYVLWDVLAQLHRPTGHAVTPIPITEAMRIPNQEEILQVQVLGRQMEAAAREIHPRLDFAAFEALKDRLGEAGGRVFEKALTRLESLSLDIRDPVRLLYVLKKIGPEQFESFFGLGPADESWLHGRQPLMIVDYFRAVQNEVSRIEKHLCLEPSRWRRLQKRRVVLTSTDVHEHALFVLHKTLKMIGASVFNIGSEKSAAQIADALIECGAEILAVSTHNGMALDFCRILHHEMAERDLNVPVFLGGRLNQTVEGEDLPLDVTGQLQELGFIPCQNIEEFLSAWTNLLLEG